MPYRKSIKINKKHAKGEQAEHLAASWLTKEGNYVYYGKNRGPFDLVIVNPNTCETTYIDVKCVSRRSDKNKTKISRSRPKSIPKFINYKILNVDLEKNLIWFNPGKKGIKPSREKII